MAAGFDLPTLVGWIWRWWLICPLPAAGRQAAFLPDCRDTLATLAERMSLDTASAVTSRNHANRVRWLLMNPGYFLRTCCWNTEPQAAAPEACANERTDNKKTGGGCIGVLSLNITSKSALYAATMPFIATVGSLCRPPVAKLKGWSSCCCRSLDSPQASVAGTVAWITPADF